MTTQEILDDILKEIQAKMQETTFEYANGDTMIVKNGKTIIEYNINEFLKLRDFILTLGHDEKTTHISCAEKIITDIKNKKEE